MFTLACPCSSVLAEDQLVPSVGLRCVEFPGSMKAARCVSIVYRCNLTPFNASAVDQPDGFRGLICGQYSFSCD